MSHNVLSVTESGNSAYVHMLNCANSIAPLFRFSLQCESYRKAVVGMWCKFSGKELSLYTMSCFNRNWKGLEWKNATWRCWKMENQRERLRLNPRSKRSRLKHLANYAFFLLRDTYGFVHKYGYFSNDSIFWNALLPVNTNSQINGKTASTEISKVYIQNKGIR